MDRQPEILGSLRQTVTRKGLGRAFSSAMARRQLARPHWALPIAAALALSACGQKGPLYLPPPAKAAAPTAAPDQTTPHSAATPGATAPASAAATH